ncbi:MAG: thioredoxin-dependent thiol peroxidase [Micrococcales bacterium]|nr:MAG: thioredoxin-dependent thiol peroxidase [Micrococcales bacterium]
MSTPRLGVGDIAPDFTLPTDDGTTFALDAHRDGKVIVYFYPAAMTPGCTTQACDFTDNLDELRSFGYLVVGVSPDPVDKLARFRERHGLRIVLASDPDRAVLQQYGAYGEKKNYGKVVQGVIRSTVVVDQDGTVAHAAYNVRAKGHVAKLRRDLGLD